MFYDRLNRLCKEKGIALTNLVKEMGMSQGNMSRWKNGNVPKSDTVSRFATYFHVSTDYLLGNADEKTAPPSEDESAVPKEILNLADRLMALSPERRKNLVDTLQFLIEQQESQTD